MGRLSVMSRTTSRRSILFAVFAVFSLAIPLESARADVTPEGDVLNLFMGEDVRVGNTGSGTLTIDGASFKIADFGSVGYASSATGVVSVVGPGSDLAFLSSLCVGNSGSGTLSVSGGGRVTYGGSENLTPAQYVGYSAGSMGAIMVDGIGSTLEMRGSFGVYIGNSGSAVLSITNGATATSAAANGILLGNLYGISIGDASGSSGTVTVDGTGSTWSAYGGGCLYVGNNGSGRLSITNNARVWASETSVGACTGSTGIIDFGANGGTLTAKSLCASASQLTGTGTIITNGLVSDIDLRFDSTHPLTQALVFQQSGQNIAVNLDMTGGTSTVGSLGAGWKGTGSLTIRDGIKVNSSNGYLGYGSGSTGVATVDGTGSTWTNSNRLCVGYCGGGTLSILNGAGVSANETQLGVCPGSSGAIDFGANGGTLTTKSLCFSSPTQFSGTGTINTNGIVRDGNLTFDSAHGLKQTFVFQEPGQNVTVNLDMTASPNPGSIGAGWNGAGSLTILQGGVSSYNGYLGYGSGSKGMATVAGTSSSWRLSDNVYVGYNGSGTLSIVNGGGVGVDNDALYIGYGFGSTGVVTVDGKRSRCYVAQRLYVGNSGSGSLSITNGGSAGSLVTSIGSTGVVTVDGPGSIFGVSGNYSNLAAISVGGTLSVTSGGSVSVASGYSYIGTAPGSTGVVMVDGSGSTWTIGSNLYVGSTGSGMLSITHGGHVSGSASYISGGPNSTAAVRVDGAGSTWANSGLLYVGGYTSTYPFDTNGSSGTVSITSGGSVTSSSGTIGYGSGSTGVVVIDGAGSAWTNSGALYVGNSGSGTLSVAGGGAVAATSVSVNSTSLAAVDVTRGSLLTVGSGTGTITNNGTVRILAGAGVAADGVQYSPIAAGTWTGTGTYQAIGGNWDASGHKFTASSVAPGTSGTPVPLDLASVQRALVNDNGPGGTNWQVGASFPAAGSTTNITFTATAMSNMTLDTLRGQLQPRESVLSGWTFATSNYTVNSSAPAYLSFNVGAGQPSDDLEVWHLDDAAGWTKYNAFDLTYDSTFASFTATGFSGYAMVAVPEPGTLALLAAGLLGLLACTRRKSGSAVHSRTNATGTETASKRQLARR